MSDESQIEQELSENEGEVEQEAIETPESIEFDRVRAIAEQQGWRPDGKLSPVEFLEAIPKYSERLVDRIKALEDGTKKYQAALGAQLARQNEEAKRRAEEELREATERGDYEAVQRAARQLHEPAPEIPQPVNDAQQKAAEWAERPENGWFKTDPEMARDFVALYNSRMGILGRDDPDRIIPIVEKQIRKLYSERFVNPNRNLGSTSAGNNAPRTTQVSNNRRQPTAEGQLDPQVLAQYRSMGFSDADILKSLEAYRGR